MRGFPGWWRAAGGVVAALLLAVLTIAPTFEALVCADTASVASVSLDQGVSGANQPDIDEGCCGQFGCLHGCHQTVSLPVIVGMAHVPRATPERYRRTEVAALKSDLTFGLDRPPRA